MEILLDPNIAYLLLVTGAALAILALLAPGTGLLEIGALLILLIAGWEIYRLPINLWALVVLVVGVVPFLLALRKSGQLIFLAISILTLVVGSIFLFRNDAGGPAIHPFLALVVSAFTAGFFWFAARKIIDAERARPVHDLESLIGATGAAQTDIFTEGSVLVGSELWSARSKTHIPAETAVRVVGREGFTLEVEAVKSQKGDQPPENE